MFLKIVILLISSTDVVIRIGLGDWTGFVETLEL